MPWLPFEIEDIQQNIKVLKEKINNIRKYHSYIGIYELDGPYNWFNKLYNSLEKIKQDSKRYVSNYEKSKEPIKSMNNKIKEVANEIKDMEKDKIFKKYLAIKNSTSLTIFLINNIKFKDTNWDDKEDFEEKRNKKILEMNQINAVKKNIFELINDIEQKITIEAKVYHACEKAGYDVTNTPWYYFLPCDSAFWWGPSSENVKNEVKLNEDNINNLRKIEQKLLTLKENMEDENEDNFSSARKFKTLDNPELQKEIDEILLDSPRSRTQVFIVEANIEDVSIQNKAKKNANCIIL